VESFHVSLKTVGEFFNFTLSDVKILTTPVTVPFPQANDQAQFAHVTPIQFTGPDVTEVLCLHVSLLNLVLKTFIKICFPSSKNTVCSHVVGNYRFHCI
jgi:hypothetical protein